MAVYLYHFRTPQGAIWTDYVGSEIATDEDALLEAAMAAAELMRSRPSAAMGGAFEVHNEAGLLVERVPLWRH